MNGFTFSLTSIVCVSKMKKKKGRKLLSLRRASSVFHCSHFLFSFDSWKIKFFVCFYKTKCTPFSSLLFPPFHLCFLFFPSPACPLCFMLKGGNLKVKVKENHPLCLWSIEHCDLWRTDHFISYD